MLPAAAQAQISADRPGIGDGATVQDAGTFNLEGGYAYNGGNDAFHQVGQLLVRAGLTDYLELRAGLGSFGVAAEDVSESASSTGYLGLSLGTKIGLMATERSTVSLVATTGIPATTSGAFEAEDKTAVQEVKLAIDNALTETVTLSLNGGIQYRWKAPINEQAVVIPTLSFAASDDVSVYAGYAYFSSETYSGGQNFVEGGLTFLPAPNTQLDVNFGLQLDEREVTSRFNVRDVDYFFLGVGVAQRF